MSVKVSLEQVVQQLTEALADAERADSGNKAAGTRVRKAAQREPIVVIRQQVLVSVRQHKVQQMH
jgi:hypothetical protein